MRLSLLLRLPRRFYAELDYARHMPKSYVDRAKHNVPLRNFDNRLGAPMLRVWKLPPEEHIETETPQRPWEQARAFMSQTQAHMHKQKHFYNKFFPINYAKFKPQPPQEWTIFPGDLVQVMVGKDKGKQGIVSHVIREYNAVFVDGLHMKLVLEKNGYLQSKGIPRTHMYQMQPLDPTKGEVKLVDPNDDSACDVEWVEIAKRMVRRSTKTNFEIPLPSQAYITYEYISPANYVESPKDTTADAALKFTYINPQIKTFEQEIDEELGIKGDQVKKPTYWY